ncbi:MAG: hypothetical protein LBH84_03725 [Prevotellaceae bacterium]|nr:hypothetical protein [Prevotellaceae bacterium]
MASFFTAGLALPMLAAAAAAFTGAVFLLAAGFATLFFAEAGFDTFFAVGFAGLDAGVAAFTAGFFVAGFAVLFFLTGFTAFFFVAINISYFRT